MRAQHSEERIVHWNVNICVLVVILVAGCASDVRAAQSKAREIDLGIATCAMGGKGACFRGYRTTRRAILHQLNLCEIRSRAAVSDGREAGARYQTQSAGWRVVSCLQRVANEYDAEATGTIWNAWTERVKARRLAHDHARTTIRCERKLDVAGCAPNALCYLSSDLIGEPLVLRCPDGRVITSPKGRSIRIDDPKRDLGEFPAGTEVIVGDATDLIAFSCDVSCAISTFRFERYFRGFIFKPIGRDVGAFSITLDHRRSKLVRAETGRFRVAVCPSGAVQVNAGPYPLIESAVLVEGTQAQTTSVISQVSPWRLKSDERAETEFDVVHEGTLASRWRQQVKGTARRKSARLTLTYRRLTEAGKLPVGLEIALPTYLIGEHAAVQGESRPRRVGQILDVAQAQGAARGQQARVDVTVPGSGVLSLQARGVRRSVRFKRDPFGHPVVAFDAPLAQKEVELVVGFLPAFQAKIRPGEPDVKPSPGDVAWETPWWQVCWKRRAGGAVSSIRFPFGSGRNVLAGPMRSWVATRQARFVDALDKRPTITPTRQNGKLIRVEAAGQLLDDRGRGCGARFHHRDELSEDGYIKRTATYSFSKPLENVRSFAVGCMSLRPDLNEVCVNQVSKRGRVWEKSDWLRVAFPGPPGSESSRMPLAMTAIDRGVEGIEILSGSDFGEWTRQIPGDDRHRFAVEGDRQGNVCFVLEPGRAANETLSLAGEYTFTFYIGLPRIRKTQPRNVREVVVRSTFDVKRMERLAQNGVNFVKAGFTTAGQFTANRGQLDRIRGVVDAAHALGVKVQPFQPFVLLNRGVPAWRAHHSEWQQTQFVGDRAKTMVFSSYGDYMCPTHAGFRQFLREGCTRFLDEYGLDGIYYDFCHPTVCGNAEHGPYVHSTIDGVIECLRMTRDLCHRRGEIFIGHTGWFPTIVCENFLDATIVLEELPGEGTLATLRDFTPVVEFVNATPRLLCPACLPSISWSTRDKGRSPKPEIISEFVAKCIAMGQLPYFFHMWVKDEQRLEEDEESGFLRLFRVFAQVDLARFQFRSYRRQRAVASDNDAVACSVFWAEDQALLVFANGDSSQQQGLTARIDVAAFGWPADATCELASLVTGRKLGRCIGAGLKAEGLSIAVGPRAYEIVRCARLAAAAAGGR